MNKGQRVEIVDGVLQGEKATILDVGNAKNAWTDFVLLHFDNHNKQCSKEQGYAILSEQWYEIDRLRVIE